MGYTTEHRCRRPTVFVPDKGTQHVLVLDIVLSSQKEFVDNVVNHWEQRS